MKIDRLHIERLGARADGIGQWERQDVFVPFALPGETVSGTLDGNRLTDVKILEVVEDRIKPACRHFKTCGGCLTQHIRAERLRDWKLDTVKATLATAGLTPEFRPVATSPTNSRRRAMFSGKRTKKAAVIGFHGRGSDQIVPLMECPLVRPEIEAAFDPLRRLVAMAATRKSEVRVHVTTSTGGLDIAVDGAKPLDAQTLSDVVALTHEAGFARLYWDGELVLERQPAAQRFGQANVTPPSGAFLQATAEGEAALLQGVRDCVGKSKSILDLFAGCGTFSLPLAAQAEVHAVEGDGAMLAALDQGWRKASGLKRMTTQTQDLFRSPMLVAELNKFDAVVIDPPRAGARAQTAELAQSDVANVAFVSCNPATFARDGAAMVAGGYQLNWVQVVDQFVWSDHVELVAHFSK